MTSNKSNIQLLPIQGGNSQTSPLPQTQEELQQRIVGIKEGAGLAVERIVIPFMTALVDQLGSEPVKKAAISSGLRHGSPECGKAMRIYHQTSSSDDN